MLPATCCWLLIWNTKFPSPSSELYFQGVYTGNCFSHFNLTKSSECSVQLHQSWWSTSCASRHAPSDSPFPLRSHPLVAISVRMCVCLRSESVYGIQYYRIRRRKRSRYCTYFSFSVSSSETVWLQHVHSQSVYILPAHDICCRLPINKLPTPDKERFSYP